MDSLLHKFTNGFPLWIVICSGLALWQPQWFTWFSGNWITLGLGAIMLGMGLTLTLEDFTRVLKFPRWVVGGILLQFTVMPFLGWGLGYLLNLPKAFAVGLILVACCPGGTASNVICYLGRGNVALSVTLTTFSTMVAIAATPWLTAMLAGSYMPVNAMALFYSTVQVVLLPVTLGVVLNRFAPKVTGELARFSPSIAVIVIILIVASILGSGSNHILNSGLSLLLGVLLLHAFGFILGYTISYWMNHNKSVARTVSIEVGMQNSGLGAHLARSHFPVGSGVDIPSALSALTHCIYGSVVAAVWRRNPVSDSNESDD
ncbi:MAG: bile acid:sodium symporter family protein [Psychromonas sp.]|nr:bile acid:sodium symporter family protein [Psychromonas sp.]